ncbi:HlyD family type I secretion periplasmic adaptor subunit [Sinorhizobium glycinis]|uniref:HlyD family type I secretion periplasmic adaptor subunit n=1 Tax=Sinorhizobium glycinis TaxID=1472378 RepID=UPI000AA5AC89|nr:HlyD family type I secretion periplasmic adaptor subunit [Sinorhizobium glycinis]
MTPENSKRVPTIAHGRELLVRTARTTMTSARTGAVGPTLLSLLLRAQAARANFPPISARPDSAGPDYEPSHANLSGDWRKPARIGFGIVVLTFGVLGGWAALARLDSAVVASGSIVVETDRKAVQHLAGGIVSEVLVSPNAQVGKGQVLVRLDSTEARAQGEIAKSAFFSLLAQKARLQAELDGADMVTFPRELTRAANAPLAQRAMQDQSLLFLKRRLARTNDVSILKERIAQSERQIEAVQSRSEAVRSQIESITEEHDELTPLANKGIIPVTRLTTLKRQRADLQGQLGAFVADIAGARHTIGEARLQIEQVGRKAFEEVSIQLAETSAKLADAGEKLHVADDVLSRTEIRAPRSGRVVGFKVHTIGAVVRPGETLMEIVPDDDTLVVSAKMSTVDINNVVEGQPAEIRLPSFKARSTPIAMGEVKAVAADALHDEVTRQPYYELKVSVQVSDFPEVVRAKLRPGMPAEVIVATGERTVLSYLTQPLTDAFRLGMREN